MKLPVNELSRSIPVVDDKMRPLNVLHQFSVDVARLSTIVGIGSPEGVVEAEVAREYLDTTGGPGAVKYIKQLSDIGGDRSLGWVAI